MKGWRGQSACGALAGELNQTDRGSPDLGSMAFHQSDDDPRVRVTLELRQSTLQWIDGLREEMGLRHRGAVVSRLLEELAVLSQQVVQ